MVKRDRKLHALFYEKWNPSRIDSVRTSDGCQIHFKLYRFMNTTQDLNEGDVIRVMMIPGLAADWDGWKFQIEDFFRKKDRIGRGVVCCVLDNRGIGRSSSPSQSTSYSTKRMAIDIIEMTDSLGWDRFHCVGFSMGGMIACKLATIASHKLQSLCVLSATNGGFQIIPRTLRGLKYAILGCFSCSHWLRSHCDLNFHYTKKTLKSKVGPDGPTRQELLMEEYISNSMNNTQTSHGLNGQLRACWYHEICKDEFEIIKSGSFPVLVIHGQHDILAEPRFGRELAQKLNGEYIELDGAHLIKRECRSEVSRHLIELIVKQENRYEDLVKGI